jgi:hypothetical protein
MVASKDSESGGVRRETASNYLREAGIAVRPSGGWGRASANSAIEVTTDSAAANPATKVITDSSGKTPPALAPTQPKRP